MKKLATVILSLTLVLSLTACGGTSKSSTSSKATTASATSANSNGSVAIDGTYNWNVAMNVTKTTLNYKFYEEFKKLLESKSGGKITLNLYPNGQLGGDAEQLQSLMDGSVDFSTTITSGMTSTIPEYGIFDLPNAFDNLSVMRKVEDNKDLLSSLNEASAKKGIHLMGMTDAGFRELTTNKKIQSVSDLSGMKIRVIDNPYHQAYWKSLGCSTTTMDFNEVYSSLQQKVIDAEENPYMNICANKFYEVQKYIVETNHLGHIMVFTMNKALYDGLPDNVKQLVDSCAAEALTTTRSSADSSIAQYKKTIQESGAQIITLDSKTQAQMKKLAQPVYKKVRTDLGDKLVDTFMNACKAAEKG